MANSLRFLPVLALFTAALTGCPMAGDCFPQATVNVTLDSAVDAPPGTPLVIGAVSKLDDSDVTGTDERGLPVGPAMDSAVHDSVEIVSNERSYTATVSVVPYLTWYFVFVDLDGDGRPGADEPLGVDAGNPIDSGCDEPTRAITVRPAEAR
ncbi:hypothetical protein WMF37_30690 [Sorangium sp. So ce291]|uniref:hypothetical protein n=1 Tax=Sorangium sp. So ce291 TaxID=3133294 RepID=UPI003F5DF856